MDQLTAMIAVAQLRLRLDLVTKFPNLLECTDMQTPKLAGVASAMAKLQHSLEDRAEKLQKRIDSQESRADQSFGNAHGHLDAVDKLLDDNDSFLGQIGGNGAPNESEPADGVPVGGSAG